MTGQRRQFVFVNLVMQEKMARFAIAYVRQSHTFVLMVANANWFQEEVQCVGMSLYYKVDHEY